MSGNTSAIDEVVDPVAVEQFVNLKTAGKELRTELISLLETAVKLNATLGGSSPASFAKNVKAATDATAQLIAADQKATDNKQRQAEKQEQIVNKYLVNLSKQAAAQERQDAKDIAQAEAKAAKLQAIQDKADAERQRKANVQFPTSSSSPNPVTQDDNPAVRYEPLITGQEDMAISATKSAEAIAAETSAMAEQVDVLAGLSTEYRANIETLLALQVERAANTAELKALNVEDAASGERAVFLTAEQIRLKTAIQQTNLTLSQQTKQLLAEDTSGAQMQARLDELRVAIGNLSEAELKNIEIGGVMIAEATKLDVAIKELRGSTGDASKNVGDYTNAINKSSAGIGLADKVANQFTRSIIRMGVQFLLIGAIFGAITWLYDLIKNLDIFTGRLDEAVQKLKTLKEALAGSEYSTAVKNIAELTENIRLAKEGFLDKTKVLNEYNKVLGSTLGYTDDLDKAEQNIVRNGKNYIQISLLKAAAQLALSAAAKASYEAAQVAAEPPTPFGGKNNQGSFAEGKAPDAIKKYYTDLNKEQADRQKERIDNIKKGANLQLKIFDDYQKQAAALSKKSGIDFFDGTQDTKPPKDKKPKISDKDNNDRIESQKIDLEEAKKHSKAILDNDEYTFDARKAAALAYVSQSKAIIDKEEEIVNKDTTLRHQQRLNELKKLNNQKLDLDVEYGLTVDKLTKEQNQKLSETVKKAYEDLLKNNEDAEKNAIDATRLITDQAVQSIENQKVKEIAALNKKYADGKVAEKKYHDDLKAIQDQANIDRLGAEAFQAQQVLAIKQSAQDTAIGNLQGQGGQAAIDNIKSKSGVPQAQIALDKANNAVTEAVSQSGTDGSKAAEDAKNKKQKDIQDALQDTIDVEKTAQDLINKGYEKQISKLERIGKLIEENAAIDKAAIDRSLDTQENKARRQDILDAETASKQKNLQEQINQAKRKQAIENKAAAILEITLNGAIAISKVLGQTGIFGLPLVPIVAGLTAIQLAAAIAAPIPQFFKGGITPGGNVIVGERGVEHARLPSGEQFYTPGIATMMNLPKGTVITPNHMLPETPKWVSNRTDNSDVVAAIDRLTRKEQPRPNRAKLSGWVEAQRQADAWSDYSQQHFK